MNFKKSIALALAAVTLISAGGCSKTKDVDGKVNISIGRWPDETNKEALTIQNKLKDDFMAANPDINIIPDTYAYDTKTFTMKASANQLPTVYGTYFTEVSQIIKQGYAADITEYMDKHNFTKNLNPVLLKAVTGEDGRIYGIPFFGYIQGLYINKKMFRDAGLVNEDGSIKIPDSWQEVAEFSQIIKEKTGKAGYVIPTSSNAGGWHFMNIAWSYGVEFEKQREDGTWEATFDTQEARDALQFIKDLKWKYNALLDDTVITQNDMYKYFGTSQAAMMIQNPPFDGYTYGLDKKELYLTKIPKGTKDRVAQMGGDLWMFNPGSTPEQIEAGFKWLEFGGLSPTITDEQADQYKHNFEQAIENNGIVLPREGVELWSNPETRDKLRSLRDEYKNVDDADYATYFNADDVTVQVEPAACAQQLYSILDGCIQEVITNENADVAALITQANNDFQVNHLNKM